MCLLIMRHDTISQIISTFLKGTRLSKEFSTTVVEKNCLKRLIHSPPTSRGVQTLSIC